MFTVEELTRLANVWQEVTSKSVKVSESLAKRTKSASDKGYSVEALEKQIREHANEFDNIYSCLSVRALKNADAEKNGEKSEEKHEEKQEEQKQEEKQEEKRHDLESSEEKQEEKSGGLLENMIQALVDERIKAIAPKLGGGASEIIVKSANGAKKLGGVVHDKYAEVLAMVINDRNAKKSPYLAGPAGSGKNVLCEQVAEALGLEFYYTNRVTDEYQVIGYMDANGNYHETPFYKAFKYGGVFMLDEMDASDENALITLNAALANYDFTFPNGERVKASEDFHAIAAGNTYGKGASVDYNGRNKLDASSMNRFSTEVIDYDKRIEDSLTSDKALLAYCRAFRKACKRAALPCVMSYRDISALATYTQLFDAKSALKLALYNGMDADDVNMIIHSLPEENVYTEATKELAATL